MHLSTLLHNGGSCATTECNEYSLPYSYYNVFLMIYGDDPNIFADEGFTTETSKFLIVVSILIGVISLVTFISQTSNLFSNGKSKAVESFWRTRYVLVSDLAMFYGNSYSKTVSFDFSSLTKTDFERLLSEDLIEGDEIQFFQWCLHQDINSIRADACQDIEANVQSRCDSSCENSLAYRSHGGLSWMRRMKVFLKWSNAQDILFPGATFERVLFGIEKNDRSLKRFLSRILIYFFCFPLCLTIFALIFCLGLISLGLLWPKRMSLLLFGGPKSVHDDDHLTSEMNKANFQKMKEHDNSIITMIERQNHSDMQRILREMKDIKKSLQ